jgi:anti-sigma B factor antagonist
VSRFDFETIVKPPLALVTLRGEFDLLATVEVEPELERLACEAAVEVVLVDLRHLDFLDSSGLRAVVCAHDRLDEDDKRLVLVRGPVAVQRVFEITRMTDRLEFVDAPEYA